jgi:hypothetical protein
MMTLTLAIALMSMSLSSAQISMEQLTNLYEVYNALGEAKEDLVK